MVLPSKFSAGPHKLGDPNDLTLRKVEQEIMIPQKIREKTRTEKCVPEVKAFSTCCKTTGLSMVYKCRKENSELKKCLEFWYHDEQFVKECTEDYLNERSEYRRTGVAKSQRRKESTTF